MNQVTQGFVRAEVDLDEFRLMLREAPEAFIEFMLPEEVEKNEGVEDFHLLVFARFVDMEVNRDVAALPRDHAKTTYLRLAFVYMILFSDIQFFVYMASIHSATSSGVMLARLRPAWRMRSVSSASSSGDSCAISSVVRSICSGVGTGCTGMESPG